MGSEKLQKGGRRYWSGTQSLRAFPGTSSQTQMASHSALSLPGTTASAAHAAPPILPAGSNGDRNLATPFCLFTINPGGFYSTHSLLGVLCTQQTFQKRTASLKEKVEAALQCEKIVVIVVLYVQFDVINFKIPFFPPSYKTKLPLGKGACFSASRKWKCSCFLITSQQMPSAEEKL